LLNPCIVDGVSNSFEDEMFIILQAYILPSGNFLL
jgi:hypothetical protein